LAVAVLPLLSWLAGMGCASPDLVGCIEQSDNVLIEIASGALETSAPATASWEREIARLCGWTGSYQ
jgi:hypothetical protein